MAIEMSSATPKVAKAATRDGEICGPGGVGVGGVGGVGPGGGGGVGPGVGPGGGGPQTKLNHN